VNKQNYDGDKLDEGFEGEEDLMEMNAVQQILQKKQMMREMRYDTPNVNTNIQDLMQSFSKGPAVQKKLEPTTQTAQPQSNISSFMNDNILRSQAVRSSYNPNPTPSTVRQDNSSHPLVPTKTMVGDKRLQRQEANKGNLDPFMMTTLQGDYNPAQRNKVNEPAPQSNYVSTAPGVYQSSAQIHKPVSSGPTVIVKEAALTTAPLRSQMEKEKSSLVPINVLKKKAAPKQPEPEKEEQQSKVTQPPVSEIGIRNVTNVPMPSFSFAPTPVQQKPPQNDALSAFLSEISKLEEDS
jgi:hypothetical protein